MQPKLKSLELHGYKTFASKTEFAFPGLITAIVGPNGSGKSNIADAIRWVLGEQSYSMLRGRKTEDMIFSGSEQRPRSGMASATITFDNSDGWLPIDFSEVAITRRAYRDGQNEYLLNGQKVRLREISELLGRSGLAERTYTIIGQGLVDAALALKPEERRRLFEEAAGIGLYRNRREDALNRLEATRRNIERVEDIIAELEPRLHSLEKQARRAQEYERIRADLRLLLRDWYGYHWQKSQRDLGHAKETLRAQEIRVEQARRAHEEAEQASAQCRARTQGIREHLNEWHSQAAVLHTALEQASREIAILDERSRAATNQSQTIQNDLTRLDEEIEADRVRLHTTTEENERLNKQLADAKGQLSEAENALKSRQIERSNTEKELRQIRQQLVRIETREVQQSAHKDELEQRLDNQIKSYESILSAIDQAVGVIQRAQDEHDHALQRRKEAEAERQKIRLALENHRKEIKALEDERRVLFDTRQRIENEKSRMVVQLDALEQAEKSFAGMANGAKTLLQAAQHGQIKTNLSAIIRYIDIPPEYEAPIAAALGEFSDAVLLGKAADLDQALGILEKGENGRAAILPGDWLAATDPCEPIEDADCLGVASHLVRASATHQKVIDLLLGHTLIVRDREAAVRMRERISAYTQIVTMKGEVFLPNGSVIAGREGKRSTLSRPRQKREISEAIEHLDQTIKNHLVLIDTTDLRIKQLRADGEGLEKATREVETAYELSVNAHQQAQLKLEQITHQSEWQVGQRKAIENQITKTKGELSAVKQDLEQIQADLQKTREQVRACSSALNRLSLEEHNRQVSYWNTQLAVATRAFRDASSRLGEYRLELEKSISRQKNYQERLANLSNDLSILEQEKAILLEKERGLRDQVEALRLKIEPAEEELKNAEEEYSQLHEAGIASQQALTVAERYHSQAQLELTRFRESLDSLRRRIEDDFGIVALDFEPDVTGQEPLPLDGVVEHLPSLQDISPGLEENISRGKAQLRRLGAINPDALAEYQEVHDRYRFMTTQIADLRKADADLRQVIAELDGLMKREFRKTFEAVAVEFRSMFGRLFSGGNARLLLVDSDNPDETGIDIEARLPGRREQGLSLLSGGERSLTAVALVFSLLRVSPTPFCVMDEVDAMLDEANVGRFRDLLSELSQTTQFIVITHNRNTVQTAEVIYGVTMGRDSASQVISLKLDEVGEEMTR